MPAMLDSRHSNSVAEEGGRNTGHTWTQDGQRRQAVSLARLHRLSTCPPGRSAGISYRPGHVCALLGAQRRGAQVFERAWLLHGKTLPLPRPELPRQATDEAGLSGALGSSSRDKSITGGQTPHRRKYLAWERMSGGKQVCLTMRSTVPSIVSRTPVVFASCFRNGWCKLRNQHDATPPHSHLAREQVKASHTWTKGGLHLGNRWKSHHDLDNHALPVGCETPVRRREKTDRSGLAAVLSLHKTASFPACLSFFSRRSERTGEGDEVRSYEARHPGGFRVRWTWRFGTYRPSLAPKHARAP
jgi:hypothetical protein